MVYFKDLVFRIKNSCKTGVWSEYNLSGMWIFKCNKRNKNNNLLVLHEVIHLVVLILANNCVIFRWELHRYNTIGFRMICVTVNWNRGVTTAELSSRLLDVRQCTPGRYGPGVYLLAWDWDTGNEAGTFSNLWNLVWKYDKVYNMRKRDLLSCPFSVRHFLSTQIIFVSF